MSFIVPIGFRCPFCGDTRDNSDVENKDGDGEFRNIVNAYAPKLCDRCAAQNATEPPKGHTELYNQRRTFVGMPPLAHVSAEPDDTVVVDDPDPSRR